MAMQQSTKGASGSGPNPALSDEQAEQFAASFTPAWDVDDGLGDTTNGTADATDPTATTQVIETASLGPTPDAPPIIGTPSVILSAKSTMIGVPPPAHLLSSPPAAAPVRAAASSAEVIDPENVLEVVTAPPVPAAPATVPLHVNHGMGTQMMANRPAALQQLHQAPPLRNGAATVAAHTNAPRVAIARAGSSDDLDLVPKRSSKTLLFVIAGLAIAAGLGLFLKFALTDDAPKAPPAQVVTGPAVTTAEIPPPPPKVDTPPPATATATVTVAKNADPPPPPLAIPPTLAARPTEPVAPRAPAAPPTPREPRIPRGGALPPPPAAALAPAPPPPTPKTPPKAPNGGIVRDNPF